MSVHGHKNVLSNFYSVDVNINGENHKSAEHAFQLTQALRKGNINTAERIRSANTARDAKRIGDTISTNSAWETEQVEVKTSIVEAKLKEVEVFEIKSENVLQSA